MQTPERIGGMTVPDRANASNGNVEDDIQVKMSAIGLHTLMQRVESSSSADL
jgi:hypothetical protein